MEKIDFLKIQEGDTVYIPFTVTKKYKETFEATSDVLCICNDDGDDEPDNNTYLFGYREICGYHKSHRKFLCGDIVRVTDGFGNTYESKVIRDEQPDGLVDLPCLFEGPLVVPHSDLQLLLPKGATKKLPVWPEGAARGLESITYNFSNPASCTEND